MQITPYQVIAPVISLVAIVYAWGLVFRQKKTIWEGALWTGFWLAIAVIAIFPYVLDFLTFATGFKDRQNALLITFLGILSFIIFGLIVRIEELEQRQTRLTRSMALRDAGLDKGKENDEGIVGKNTSN
ncbi:MAG: DUF2304 domain-containing protein [Candidatus Peribacteraceae bacterium]|nr:DUF2304 domain-containing protein [Candidatus Peribacteraceae bacterium]MDD5742818.1 DUF2304 domain-containing protein [Candidatus Peribacteraceae bacterium]